MMDNLKLLSYCSKNPEKFLDSHYMFVEKHKDLEKYAKVTQEIKNTLIAIKEVKNKKDSTKIVGQLFEQLYNLMRKYSNNSEFGCFINACDSSLEEVLFDKSLLVKITHLYLDKRDINDIVPVEWIQALIDKRAATKKGNAGEKKLIEILESKGYRKASNIAEFKKTNKTFAKCSGKGDFSNKGLRKHFSEKVGDTTQNKKLDLIIKKDKDVFLLEAKHMKTSGGEQNKQILELIELLRNKPKGKSTHYVGFLDGIYFNKLFGSEQPANKEELNKIHHQVSDIKKNLNKIEQNYFINTAGFKKLF